VAVKKIPARNRIPFITDLLEIRQMTSDPLQFCKDKVDKYGDVCYVPIPGSKNYLIHDPEVIREFLVTQSSKFKKSRLYRAMRTFLGDGLLTSNGAFHSQQRKLAAPAFHKQRIQEYSNTMVQCTLDEMTKWKSGVTIDISQAMTNITLQIVTRTLFNSQLDAKAITAMSDQMRILLDTTGEIFKNPIYLLCLEKDIRLPIIKRIYDLRSKIDKSLFEIIASYRKANKDTGDLLSMLIQAKDEETGIGMTDEHIRDEVMTMFLAGHETTATALSWTWYLLGTHPDVMNAFYSEVSALNRTPSADDYNTLNLTRNIFKESLRLYPPAWTIAREVIEDVEIQGYHFKKGTALATVIYLMHRNKKYFADPDAFIPQRWDEEKIKSLPKYVYFPFGGGNRMCIGEGFAWMEGVLILATIASKYRLELPTGFKTKTYPAFTLRPADSIPMKVSIR
jgi:cytochrome P450